MGVEVEGMEVRAFRGTRRSSVYREHVVSGSAFARLLAAARERGLPLLSSLAERGHRRLDPDQARQLAHESESLADALRSMTLARHLTAIAEIARWCARAPGRSWMTIART